VLEEDGWIVNVKATLLSEAFNELFTLRKEFEILDEEL
jgi:hypothetical protein